MVPTAKGAADLGSAAHFWVKGVVGFAAWVAENSNHGRRARLGPKTSLLFEKLDVAACGCTTRCRVLALTNKHHL